MRSAATFMCWVALAGQAIAEVIAGPTNPIVASMMALGTQGLQSGLGGSAPALTFRPKNPGRTVQGVVDVIVQAPEDRKTLREGIDTLMKGFEETQSGSDKYDVAGAIAFNLVVLDAIANQSDPSENKINRVRLQLRRAFRADPRVMDTNDFARQQAYETHLSVASLMLILATAASDDAAAKSLAATAKSFISAFLGTTSYAFTNEGLRIAARPRPAIATTQAPPATGINGLAPGFTVGIPSGWASEGGWYRRQVPEMPDVRSYLRFAPAVPVTGGVGQELDRQWELLRPKGKVDKLDRNYYCRFVGGAPAFYRVGQVQESHLQAPTFVCITLVKVGNFWQPVVLAVTFGSPPPPYEPGIGFTASFNYPSGIEMAEQIVRQIRVEGANRPNLFNASDLVGNYSTSTGASGAVVNVASGAVGMGYSASGVSLNLKADGTFTFRVTNVAGGPGVMASQRGGDSGRWRIEGDKLVLVGTRTERWTIMGFTRYTDANVLHVDWEPNRPAHAGTLGFAWVLVAPR